MGEIAFIVDALLRFVDVIVFLVDEIVIIMGGFTRLRFGQEHDVVQKMYFVLADETAA